MVKNYIKSLDKIIQICYNINENPFAIEFSDFGMGLLMMKNFIQYKKLSEKNKIFLSISQF